jgi:hypothetical protein
MSGINILLNKKPIAPQRTPFGTSTPYDHRVGFYAAVTEVHPENNTVHVTTDTGIELMNVKVASQAWVTYVKDGKPQLTGERYLPPVGTYVFCLMPTGNYEESFVLCSLFSDASIHKDYMEKGDDAANIKKTVENGGWNETTDFRTGTKSIKNKTEDETISIDIDQEDEGKEEVKVTIHGTVVTVNKDGAEISTDGTIKISSEKEGTLKFKGNLTVTSDGDVELSSTKTGLLKIGNSVDTLGATISSLLDYLSTLKTVGSPATQSASPDFVANIKLLKTKWGKIFK